MRLIILQEATARERVEVGRLKDPGDGRALVGRVRPRREAGAQGGDGRNAGGQLEVPRVGRPWKDTHRQLFSEHNPARVAEGRDERVGGVDLGGGHEDLEVEVRVEVGVVGGRVAQERLMFSSSDSRVMPGTVRMSHANSAEPG
jgi:hypothetical protein